MSLQNKKFILMIIDDFHAIHAIQDPKTSTTSTVIHMATEIIDVHNDVSAIPVPANLEDIHQLVLVDQQQCRGGISYPNIQQLFVGCFNQYFQATLPNQFLEFDMQNAQQCVEHLRLKNITVLLCDLKTWRLFQV